MPVKEIPNKTQLLSDKTPHTHIDKTFF